MSDNFDYHCIRTYHGFGTHGLLTATAAVGQGIKIQAQALPQGARVATVVVVVVVTTSEYLK